MHYHKQLCLCGAFLLGFLSVSSFSSQKINTAQAALQVKSLVRMDLLVFPEKTLPSPQRNIFTVDRSVGRESVQDKNLENPGDVERAEARLQEEQARSSVSLRYIGYVKSGQKITALIIFEREALAVEEGEMISLGLQVAQITLEEISVIGLDQEMQTFPLEGDRP